MPNNAATEAARLSIAPMMDWTDRHCRMFHRRFTRRTLLYTEMITAAAVLRGPRARLLRFDPEERPLALQLGGGDAGELAEATRIAVDHGFDEINLNVGCPSDRVRAGCFGAALMLEPDRVAGCVAAMIAVADGTPVTVKCRIGVDDQDPRAALPDFLARIAGAGVRRVAIHARKAWLEGLSPKQNREIPPLDHALVLEMKAEFPALSIAVNGGIQDLDQALGFLAEGLDGVMIGRAAYHDPSLLAAADRRVFGERSPDPSPEAAVAAMLPYIDAEIAGGARLNQITRHMLGAFSGRPGARAWRRRLSEEAHRPGAGAETVLAALASVSDPVIAEAV